MDLGVCQTLWKELKFLETNSFFYITTNSSSKTWEQKFPQKSVILFFASVPTLIKIRHLNRIAPFVTAQKAQQKYKKLNK